MDNLDLAIRLGTKDDVPFILDSWRRMSHKTYPNKYILDFPLRYQKYLHSLLPQCVSLVACLSDMPEAIVGWIVYTSSLTHLLAHYAYVRAEERRQGIMKQLLSFANPAQLGIVFTHPAANENIMQHLSKQYIFDPTASPLYGALL